MLTQRMTMSDILRSIWVFIVEWTKERGRELVTDAPTSSPGSFAAVTVTAIATVILISMVATGAL